MSYHRLALEAQKDPQSDNGLLYTVEAVKTDIRRTFREKYGWVGPEEQRRLAELQRGGDHALS
jgi:hypothetical protein